ncbi:MAG TPA: hypothetical protein PKE69_19210, partial [Pyrinomonadaceae bacterium]|nr:hypothetical protein [Pyrinomonadaceae bacterium]
NFLARLYTNTELRRAFLSEPEKIGAENGLSKTEISEFAEVLPEELNFFAESLFWKRLREVEKFLPLTKDSIGNDFIKQFRGFSQTFNPQTVKKHLEDAIGFCKFLQKKDVSEFNKNIAKFEGKKLEFYGYGKRFAVCRLNYDLREILHRTTNLQNEFPRRKTISIWFKIGKKIKHFSI